MIKEAGFTIVSDQPLDDLLIDHEPKITIKSVKDLRPAMSLQTTSA